MPVIEKERKCLQRAVSRKRRRKALLSTGLALPVHITFSLNSASFRVWKSTICQAGVWKGWHFLYISLRWTHRHCFVWKKLHSSWRGKQCARLLFKKKVLNLIYWLSYQGRDRRRLKQIVLITTRYIHTHTHLHTNTHTHTCTRTYADIYTHVYTHTRAHTHKRTCTDGRIGERQMEGRKDGQTERQTKRQTQAQRQRETNFAIVQYWQRLVGQFSIRTETETIYALR